MELERAGLSVVEASGVGAVGANRGSKGGGVSPVSNKPGVQPSMNTAQKATNIPLATTKFITITLWRI